MSQDLRPRGDARLRRRTPLTLLACAAVMGMAVVHATDPPPDARNQARKNRLRLLGGGAMRVVAKSLGVNQVEGKTIAAPADEGKDQVLRDTAVGVPNQAAASAASSSSGPVTEAGGRSAHNVAIQDFPHASENEPTVAVNPRDPSRLVAAHHFYGDQNIVCAAHYSRDGGKTWNLKPIVMPQLTHDSSCSDSVLSYAPDGSRVYFAYMDIKLSGFDVVVSYSDDDGKSWTGPVTVLTAGSAADFDKPWIGTHVPVGDDDDSHQANSNWVYATATKFDNTPPFACHIAFARSSNKGVTWSPFTVLDSSVGGCGSSNGPTAFFPVVQGSRPTGGLGNGVVAAWYNSGTDGFLNGNFNIRTRYSSDNGASFGPITVASNETTMFELPFWLGPFAQYHRWWGGMFPDVEIAPDGSAHIAYVAAPVASPGGFATTAANGDIRYVTSAGRPYASWSLATTVNDDTPLSHAHGWAALEATSGRSGPVVYVLWEDHRNADPGDNQIYDVFWSKKVGAGMWSANAKLTDAASPSDFIFLGDYFDIAIARGDDDHHGDDPFVYGVWTDRRAEPDIFHFNDDIWGARIPPAESGDDHDGEDHGKRR
jgi:hypothetical protein